MHGHLGQILDGRYKKTKKDTKRPSATSEEPGAKPGYWARPLHTTPPKKAWANHATHSSGLIPRHTPILTPYKEQVSAPLGELASKRTCGPWTPPVRRQAFPGRDRWQQRSLPSTQVASEMQTGSRVPPGNSRATRRPPGPFRPCLHPEAGALPASPPLQTEESPLGPSS